MKTTKKLLSSLYIVGLLSAASAGAAVGDNTVKYGEKYFCDIQTVEGKNYSLEIEWSAEPIAYSHFPQWHNVMTYSLKQNDQDVDGGYFSNIGFGQNKLDFTFAWDQYLFSGFETQSTRIGVNYYGIDIKLAKSYDNQTAKPSLAVAQFASSSEKNHLRNVVTKTFELNIQTSTCSVSGAVKD